MRQSEREARLADLVAPLFQPAPHVLAVGGKLPLGERSVIVVDEPAATVGMSARFAAALWWLSSDTAGFRSGLAVLRNALAPGAALVVAAPRRAPALQQLRAVLAGESAPRARLEPLCDALLLGGFLAPRVHESLPGWLVVSASLPAHVDPLDTFFEQPGAVRRR